MYKKGERSLAEPRLPSSPFFIGSYVDEGGGHITLSDRGSITYPFVSVTLSDTDRGVTVPSCRDKKRLFVKNTVSFCPCSMPSSVPHIVTARAEPIEVSYRHRT